MANLSLSSTRKSLYPGSRLCYSSSYSLCPLRSLPEHWNVFFFSWLAFSIEAVVSTGVRTTKSMEFDLLKCLTFATGYDTPWVNHHDNRLSTMKRQDVSPPQTLSLCYGFFSRATRGSSTLRPIHKLNCAPCHFGQLLGWLLVFSLFRLKPFLTISSSIPCIALSSYSLCVKQIGRTVYW